MKFLGTIIKITNENFLSLIDFPVGISDLNTPADIIIGYSEGTGQKYTISEYKISKKRLHILLKQSLSFEQLLKFKEMGVFIEQDNIIFDINDDAYFISDLVGCEVYTHDDEKYLGNIVDIYTMPANDVWVVRTEEGDLPIPAVKEFIADVNMEERKINVILHAGLTDLIEPL